MVTTRRPLLLVALCLAFACDSRSNHHDELDRRIAALAGSPLHAELRTTTEKLLADAGSDVWVRFPDWAVMRGELKTFVDWNHEDGDRHPAAEESLRIVRRYAQTLAAHDISLLVVPVPGRIEVDPDRIPGVSSPPAGFSGANLGYARYLADLRDAGVEVVDLLPVLAAARAPIDGERTFHDYNRHWTPRAVLLAAEVIAKRALELSGLERGAARAGVDYEVRSERIEYQLPPLIEEARAPLPLHVHRVVRSDGTPAHRKDRESPILFLGDSFGSYYSGEASDVVSHLYTHLGMPLDTITIRGGGANEVWKSLERRGDELAGKRIVVWLFTAQYLVQSTLTLIELFPN